MGGDNFNKNSSESGNNSKSDADLLLAAINAGKKHRQSTPERLEKEAEKLLNSIVDQFIIESDMYSTIEKAATEGRHHTFIGHNNLTKLFPDFQSVTGDWSEVRHHRSRNILSISDKGGSGLSESRTVDDFIELITEKFFEVVTVTSTKTWYAKVPENQNNEMFHIDWSKTV